jgi:hypothetical protein
MQVTNPEEEQMFSTRGRVAMLVLSIVLLLGALGGGAWWLVNRLSGAVDIGQDGVSLVIGAADNHPEPETEVQGRTDRLPADVERALKAARMPVPACEEQDALEQWDRVREMLEDYPEAAAEEIAQAQQRIADLKQKIAERRKAVRQVQNQLSKAAASARKGEKPEARRELQEVMRQIGELACRGPQVEQIQERAVALQNRLTAAPEDDQEVAMAPPPIEDEPEQILDKPAPGTPNRWISERWANDVEIELKGRGQDLYRSLVLQRGSKGKWVVTMARPMDLSALRFLLLDMRVQEQVSVALGIWEGNQLYESRPFDLPNKDKWQSVAFDLKSDNFKCAETNWNFGARISDPKAVTKFSLFFYSRARHPILFANVRLHKGD